jgi:hypothetical protein
VALLKLGERRCGERDLAARSSLLCCWHRTTRPR